MNRPRAVIFGATFVVLLLDRVAKLAITPRIINSYGWLGSNIFNSLNVLLALALVVALAIAAVKEKSNLLASDLYKCLAVLILDNLWDRLVTGGVIDYIQIGKLWFNLCDLAITFVCFALIFIFVLHGKHLHGRG